MWGNTSKWTFFYIYLANNHVFLTKLLFTLNILFKSGLLLKLNFVWNWNAAFQSYMTNCLSIPNKLLYSVSFTWLNFPIQSSWKVSNRNVLLMSFFISWLCIAFSLCTKTFLADNFKKQIKWMYWLKMVHQILVR